MKAAHLLAACLLMWGQAVWGHAALVSADPAPGAVLDRAPGAAVLMFNEPVSVTALRLLGPEGPPVDVKPEQTGGSRIRVPLPGGAGRGAYLLSWRVVSADGHPVGGALDYTVGPAAGPAAASARAGAAESPPAARQAAIWLGRWLGYACLFACVGAALFRTRNPSDRQAWARPLVWLGLGLLPVNLGLQGLDLLDLPRSALAGWPAWAAALDSRYAWTLGLTALALLASAAALRARRPGMVRGCAGAGLALAGVALAASGHAGTAPPQWLSRPLVVLHVATAAAWLGALVPLLRLLGAGGGGRAGLAPLAWFSRWITSVVLVLLASGAGLALLQLDRPGDLWRTSYGIVLSAKLVLVCGLLALAAFNRWRCTGPALAGEAAARARLRRSIQVETAVAVVLLGVVSLWRFTPPPRSLDAAVAESAPRPDEGTASFMLSNDRAHALLTRSGGAWLVALSDPSGQPLAAEGLTLALSNPQAGIEPLRREARRLPDGRWRVEAGSLPASGAGHWRLSMEILVNDFEQVTLEGVLPP
ncbi:copper resistance CopC/CopD family protein [Castellaniella defragrans]|uniref:Copper transport protein n=3 Tax=Castellaniella defragrans TaxID=75697 RepID=A0A7W9WLU9_CASDE|nr:CopD family protein [Castellaniella defragrans]MBB6083632.1 copper transport protein [Castellaniella defragrans]